MFGKKKLVFLSLMVGGSLMFSGISEAHHSKAMFDMTKCLSVEGTVRAFEWQYPHSWLWVEVRNNDGTLDTWGFETMSPAQMIGVDHRWTRDTVKKGDAVTVRFAPLTDGRHGGDLSTVKLTDGRVMLGTPQSCQGVEGTPHNPGAALN